MMNTSFMTVSMRSKKEVVAIDASSSRDRSTGRLHLFFCVMPKFHYKADYILDWFEQHFSSLPDRVVKAITETCPEQITLYRSWHRNERREKLYTYKPCEFELEAWFERAWSYLKYEKLPIRTKFVTGYKVEKIVATKSSYHCKKCYKQMKEGEEQYVWIGRRKKIFAGFCSKACSDMEEMELLKNKFL